MKKGIFKKYYQKYYFSYFLAIKNVFYRKRLLILLGTIIALGYVSMIFSGSILYGLQFLLEEKGITALTGHILIEPDENTELLTNIDNIEKKIWRVPGVVGVSSHINREVILKDSEGKRFATTLKIIDPHAEATATAIDDSIIDGSFLGKRDTGKIVLGGDFLEKYRSQEGLRAISAKSGEIIHAVFDNGAEKELKVSGVYSLNFAYTDIFAYINREDAKEIFNFTEDELNSASEILVRLSERGNEQDVIYQLQNLGIRGKIWPWQDKLGMLTQFTDSLLIISNIMLFLGIAISFATIYIMIYINVMSRKVQIGVLKAIGISKKKLQASYIFQSLIYSIIGIVFGMIATSLLLLYLSKYPIAMPLGLIIPVFKPYYFILATVTLLAASSFAGYFASRGVINEPILSAIMGGER
jgi:putative ABC transport system permease protein